MISTWKGITTKMLKKFQDHVVYLKRVAYLNFLPQNQQNKIAVNSQVNSMTTRFN